MSVKSSVSFTERHHEFAKRKVDEGVYTSVSSLVALGIERLMQEDAEREAALQGLSQTIAQRMQTPKDEWVEMSKDDDTFARVLQRINNNKD